MGSDVQLQTLKMISPISTIADMPDGITVRKRAANVTTLINKGSPRQARRLKEQAEAATTATRVMETQASPKRPRSFVSESSHPYPAKAQRMYATQAEGVHHGIQEQEWHA